MDFMIGGYFMIYIIALTKTWCDGSNNHHTEDFVGLNLEDIYKEVCEYLFDDEYELFTELGFEFPTQSIEFIKGDVDSIYQKFLDSMMAEIIGMGSYSLEVSVLNVSLVIDNNVVKRVSLGE